MRVNATLLLAAIPMAAFVEADAFISPASTSYGPSTKRSGHAKMPLTAASVSGNQQRQQRMESWSSTAMEMSGGGEGGEAAVSTEGTATIPDEVFNLVKSIVGAGVLSLPAGECTPLLSFFYAHDVMFIRGIKHVRHGMLT